MDEISCLTPFGLALFLAGRASEGCSGVLSVLVTSTEATPVMYLQYFLSTFALELPVYSLFLQSKGIKKVLAYTFVLNLLTHPIIFFAFPFLLEKMSATYGIYLLCAEVFAPLVEGIVLSRLAQISLRKSLAIAVVANLFSWWAGVYLF